MTKAATLLVDCRCSLGEGPVWHDGLQKLFWFDINGQTMFCCDAEGQSLQQWPFDEIVTAAAIVDDQSLVLATETGLRLFEIASGQTRHIADIESDIPTNRSNDSRVHPSGAFWVGTMVKDEGPKLGAVYHFGAGKVTRIVSDVAIPNATCFSPDGRIAYWTDTPEQKILQCPTDPETGLPNGEWTLFADVADHPGYPDGAVVDSEGYVWNARWGGSCVIRYAPDGQIDRIVDLPVSQVTCPAFGGKDLKRMFLTSANKGLSTEQLAKEPSAGSVFFIDLDVAGLPEARIKL